MTSKQNATQQGVSDAFWDFISDRDHSTLDAVRAGAKDAVREWLDHNSDHVIAAIAKAVADNQPDPEDTP